jgi:hypothetical protein
MYSLLFILYDYITMHDAKKKHTITTAITDKEKWADWTHSSEKGPMAGSGKHAKNLQVSQRGGIC